MVHEHTAEEALDELSRSTFCLWMGAGVATQLGLAGGESVPGWEELVSSLEARAHLGKPPFDGELPDRLDICLAELGREAFQRGLRAEIVSRIARAVVAAAKRSQAAIPSEVRQLAHLGSLANPIVNFNIETLTSECVASPMGSWRPLVFNPPVPDALSGQRTTREAHDRSRYCRHVYHPHGALDISGVCVLGRRDYGVTRGTLALQLAAHAAFELNLAIVGMSLDDAYLRQQLEEFRSQVRTIYWFTSGAPKPSVERWPWRNRVVTVHVQWPQFWEAVETELPAPSKCSLWSAWYSLVTYSLRLLGNPAGEQIPMMRAHGFPPEALLRFTWDATLKGEDPALAADPPNTALEDDELVMQLLKETARQCMSGGEMGAQTGDMGSTLGVPSV